MVEPTSAGEQATVESEMVRLTAEGRYEVTVGVTNPGSIAQFFHAEIKEPRWACLGRWATCFGWGSGDTVLDALRACEKVALDGVVSGYEPSPAARPAASETGENR